MIAAVLTVCFIGMSCGGSSTGSSNTFPTGGANGTNTVVTNANAGTVYAGFNTAYVRVLAQGHSGLATKPIASKPTKKVTVNGQNSGTATFDGSYSISGSTINYNAKITFNNFSDDGDQFYQGSLTWAYKIQSGTITGSYKGMINIQGDYKANMTYDLTFTGSSFTGTIKIKSGDEPEFTFNLSD
ncbi:MAG: hypothetical protein FJY97_06695 [candidate division Zixibacteria bacterium]|nr:hypothetical protein [candidate division Zixibacteria bacterium]